MKAIYWFTSKQEWDDVNDKIYEYEWYENHFWFTWDRSALLLNWDISWSDNIDEVSSEYTKILAYDYLHWFKLNDIVELQDDSEYSWWIYKVTCIWDDDDFRLEHAVKPIIWRHQDYLHVLKDHKVFEEPTEEFKVGDKVEIVKEETDTYPNFSSNCWDRTMAVWDTFIVKEVYWDWLRQTKWLSSWVHKNLCKVIHDTLLYSDEEYSPVVEYATTSILSTGDATLTEDNVKDIVSTMINESADKTCEEILNTNKQIMNIKSEENRITNEAFFDNKKEINKFRKVNNRIIQLRDILEEAQDNINNKRSKLNWLYSKLNTAFTNKNSVDIKEIVSDFWEIEEFIIRYIENTVNELWSIEEDKETFNINEFFLN